MRPSTYFAELTAAINAAVLAIIGYQIQICTKESSYSCGYSLVGTSAKGSAFARYFVHLQTVRNQTTGTAILTDYGVASRGPATTTKGPMDFSDVNAVALTVAQFLTQGTLPV